MDVHVCAAHLHLLGNAMANVKHRPRSEWEHKPDGDLNYCQCVMDHRTGVEGEWLQCHARRHPISNLYCSGCEQAHGVAWKFRTTHGKEGE